LTGRRGTTRVVLVSASALVRLTAKTGPRDARMEASGTMARDRRRDTTTRAHPEPGPLRGRDSPSSYAQVTQRLGGYEPTGAQSERYSPMP
jgi:hypothetical protein